MRTRCDNSEGAHSLLEEMNKKRYTKYTTEYLHKKLRGEGTQIQKDKKANEINYLKLCGIAVVQKV